MHTWFGLVRMLAALSPLLLVLLSFAETVSASPAPPFSPTASMLAQISVSPAYRLAVPGQVFTLTLAINGAVNAAAFETTFTYSPAYLQILAVTHPAPSFFAVNGRSAGRPPAEPIISFVDGRVTTGEYSFGSSTAGKTGNGTLALLRFQALSVGGSFLQFNSDPRYPTELLDPYGNPQFASTLDGYVLVVPEQHLYLPAIRR